MIVFHFKFYLFAIQFTKGKGIGSDFVLAINRPLIDTLIFVVRLKPSTTFWNWVEKNILHTGLMSPWSLYWYSAYFPTFMRRKRRFILETVVKNVYFKCTQKTIQLFYCNSGHPHVTEITWAKQGRQSSKSVGGYLEKDDGNINRRYSAVVIHVTVRAS